MVSWDPCLGLAISKLETWPGGTAPLVSRALTLLVDSLAAADKSGAKVGMPVGVEAVGLVARLATSQAGRRVLITHCPGAASYLIPCLRANFGQTAAFAARAISGIARAPQGCALLLRHSRGKAVQVNISLTLG